MLPFAPGNSLDIDKNQGDKSQSLHLFSFLFLKYNVAAFIGVYLKGVVKKVKNKKILK